VHPFVGYTLTMMSKHYTEASVVYKWTSTAIADRLCRLHLVSRYTRSFDVMDIHPFVDILEARRLRSWIAFIWVSVGC
jgi:hypothetical protein